MVEFIGLLKVTIKSGTNLAVRDMMSSDPYVVLTLGKQVSHFVSIFRQGSFFLPKLGLDKVRNGKCSHELMFGRYCGFPFTHFLSCSYVSVT